jgi:hypothetical protein
MKRCAYRSVVVAALSLAFAGSARAQDAAKGASLLGEARKALGGEDKLRAVKTLDLKGDFKRAAGQNTIEGDLEIRIERPDKMRRDEDLSPPGGGPAIVRTEVLNGADVWDENSGGGGGGFGGFGGGGRGGGGGGGFAGRPGRNQPGQPAGDPAAAGQRGGRGIDPAQIKELQRRTRQADLSRYNLMLLLDTNAPVSWVGIAESPDGKADVLEITPADGGPMRLFLDQSSHVPLMVTWQGPVVRGGGRGRGGDQAQPQVTPPPPPQPPTLQLTLGDYKTVNGIKLPHLITRGTGGQTIEEWTVRSYKINPSFKSDVFNK